MQRVGDEQSAALLYQPLRVVLRVGDCGLGSAFTVQSAAKKYSAK